MDFIIKKALSLTEEEKTLRGIVGIPDNWPIEKYQYVDTIPENFELISEENLNLLIANNQTDYDAWLQSLRPIIQLPAPAPMAVQTQFERTDIVLKVGCQEATFDENGFAEVSIKVPGTPGTEDGRYVAGGYAFTDSYTFGDRITKIQVVDIDNILGYGAETVVKTYHDQDLIEGEQGWFMWPAPQVGGEIEIDPMGYYGFIPAGLYLEIYFQRAASGTATKVYIDYYWGKSK
jgi:hypothetical protein